MMRLGFVVSSQQLCQIISVVAAIISTKLGFPLIDLKGEFMNATVSIFTEIPESLHDSLKNYLEKHPDWDQNRVLTAALSLFLLQNGDGDRHAARVYLETLFHHC